MIVQVDHSWDPSFHYSEEEFFKYRVGGARVSAEKRELEELKLKLFHFQNVDVAPRGKRDIREYYST
jgi:hypothetical protein